MLDAMTVEIHNGVYVIAQYDGNSLIPNESNPNKNDTETPAKTKRF